MMKPASITTFLRPGSARKEHALEPVGERNGIPYVNDSASVSLRMTCESIEAIDAELVLIVGGKDHASDYSWLLEANMRKVKTIIYLSMDVDRLFRVTGKMDVFLVVVQDLKEAVQTASTIAMAGQVVLFSPGCPSYDIFDNYKNRGNLFKTLVHQP